MRTKAFLLRFVYLINSIQMSVSPTIIHLSLFIKALGLASSSRFIQTPQSQAIVESDAADFGCEATGPYGDLHYEWLHNGEYHARVSSTSCLQASRSSIRCHCRSANCIWQARPANWLQFAYRVGAARGCRRLCVHRSQHGQRSQAGVATSQIERDM